MHVERAATGPADREAMPLTASCQRSVDAVLAHARSLLSDGGLPLTAPQDVRSAQRLMRDIRSVASQRVRRAVGEPLAAVPVLGLAVLVDDAWATLELIRESLPTGPSFPPMAWIRTLQKARDVDELLDRTGAVLHTLGFPRTGISFIDSGVWTMQRAYVDNDPALSGRVCGLSARDPRRLTVDSFEGRVAARRRGLLVSNVDSQQERTHGGIVRELGITTVLMLPLVVGESTVGLLHADVSSMPIVTLPERARMLADFASVYSVVMDSVRLNEAIVQFQAKLSGRWPSRTRAVRDSDTFGDLTPRETEVLELVARGMTNEEIAATLVLSSQTVKAHVKHVLRKLGVSNRAAAAARYLRRSG
jgi:DNA-binding CsgD family transcriptional regulator